MAKYVASVCIGVFSLAWLSVVYAVAFEHLYIWVPVSEGIEFCAQYFERTGLCKGVAYFSLWVMETPLLMATFLSISVATYACSRFVKGFAVIAWLVVSAYLAGYLLWTNLGPFGGAIGFWYNLGVTLYHGGLFMGCLWAAGHLTNRSTRPP